MSKIGLSNVLIFAAGAVVGSAVTYKLLRDKFEKIANEEIESVKEMYREMNQEEDEEPDPEIEQKKADLDELHKYRKVLEESRYLAENENAEEEEDDVDKPYPLDDPDEFGELDGYNTEILYYYADGVLTDDFDNIIEDVNGVVGEDSLKLFKTISEDTIYVRNDRLKTDYEILRDHSTYAEASGRTYPHHVEE